MSIKPLIYRSTDAGAPQLTGQAGSLVAVLDAVLVNGYGVGVDAKAPAGWTLEFSGTNKRAYRNSVTHGTGTYLRVDDTGGAPASDARVTLMRAFESMTDADTGANAAPLTSQSALGLYVQKSDAANGTTRYWTIVACSTYCYLFIADDVDTNAGWTGFGKNPYFFGDYDSVVPGDDYNFLLAGDFRTSFGGTAGYSGYFMRGVYAWTMPMSSAIVSVGGYVMRAIDGATGAVAVQSGADSAKLAASSSAYMRTWGGTDGLSPAVDLYERGAIVESRATAPVFLRGFMPGLLVPLKAASFADGHELDGILGNSRRYIAKRIYTSHGTSGGAGNYPEWKGCVLLEAYEHD